MDETDNKGYLLLSVFMLNTGITQMRGNNVLSRCNITIHWIKEGFSAKISCNSYAVIRSVLLL